MSSLLLKSILENTPQDIVDRYSKLPQLAQNYDFGNLDEDIVVIDTETTGVSLKKDELTQIAAAKLRKGVIEEWFITFVNPGKPIPLDITYLTNIKDEDVASAPTPDIAVQQLVNFVGDCKLVAHNANFDKNFLTKHPSGYPLLNNIWIDSLDLAKIALPRMKSHRLIDLVKAFDAPVSTHRADDDVAATCALYRILLAAVFSMPIELVQKINEISSDTNWQTRYVFSEVYKLKSEDPDVNSLFSLEKLRRKREIVFNNVKKMDAINMVSEESLKNKNIKIIDSTESPVKKITFPTDIEITNAFNVDGVIGKQQEGFETRETQIILSNAVNDAFKQGSNLIAEAGTGVGKSLAYLLPAALLAKRNDITVGIATKTNALLDQLMYKELPGLSEALGGLKFSSLKGFNHYLCLLKVQDVIKEKAQTRLVFNEERNQAAAIAAMLSFIEQSAFDDIDNLKIDYRVLPKNSITTTSHDCLRKKCPFFNNGCFVMGARKSAEYADILVTNHSLLFCDIATDNALLPPIRYWVCDEAHGIEAEARRAFEKRISDKELKNYIYKASGLDTKRNIYKKAERILDVEGIANDNSLFFSLLNKAKSEGEIFKNVVEEFLNELPKLLFFSEQKKSAYDQVEVWINDAVRNSETFSNIKLSAVKLQNSCEKMISTTQDLVIYLQDEDKAGSVQRELAGFVLDLKELYSAIDVIFVNNTEEYVYSAILHKNFDKGENVIIAQPFNVGRILNEDFYTKVKSVIFLSATLSVNGGFSAFENALGLNGDCRANVKSLMLDSDYNFNKNMKVFVVQDIPDPTQSDYLNHLTDLLKDVHLAQDGSVLTLFTNKKEMEKVYPEVRDAVQEKNLRVICQKSGVSIKGLRDDFLKDEKLSLFALKSFWEGFDAPGATLKAVVIPKLPFSKPSDALNRERAYRDDAAWSRYTLPQAVLEVKQAAGRLLRRSDDTGIFIIADSRVAKKGYGKVFLNSLPSNNIEFVKMKDLPEKIVDIEFV
jgi:ATP-dependent DNA helicase DinG